MDLAGANRPVNATPPPPARPSGRGPGGPAAFVSAVAFNSSARPPSGLEKQPAPARKIQASVRK
jgi:hypothetical protein